MPGNVPFCYIEKHAEERLMDFVLGAGASYMEADIREQTDKAGFCRAHFKKMFGYGNAAWERVDLKDTLPEDD